MIKGRLNSKGITLVELIVSFVIVAVAVIYFYQMLTSVTRMYAKARDGINHSARVNYAFRLLDEAYEQDPNNACDLVSSPLLAAEVIEGDFECVINFSDFDTIRFVIDGNVYFLYKYPKNSLEAPEVE